jgi:hypothetical protein
VKNINAKNLIALTKKDHVIPLDEKGSLRIQFAGHVNLSGVTDEGEIILLEVLQGSGRRQINLEGFKEVVCSAASLPASIGIISETKQKAEPLNDDPTPPKAQPANILQQMRSEFRRNLGIGGRESFVVNDTGLPGYETDDDDDLFEEEIIEKAKAEREEAKKKAEEEREAAIAKAREEGRKENAPTPDQSAGE